MLREIEESHPFLCRCPCRPMSPLSLLVDDLWVFNLCCGAGIFCWIGLEVTARHIFELDSRGFLGDDCLCFLFVV